MSMVGELIYFLGLQGKQLSDGIFISKSKYARNMLQKFGLENASPKHTPASTHAEPTKDSNAINVDESLYRSMIGSLLYLVASRPDIAYDVGVCARYQSNPKTNPLTIVKQILKYISGTVDYDLLYSSDSCWN
ncbi:uncharacterized mitochondrial protein AtMg00810-like [Benincasa hispida]|uniref:uncharacterized mitochondrial protein AtMg00810-like n=1 Tax=Benincasa hispida TaxID=102211 RepID=UPI00190128D5|nr:uncharacterized mitochondrial protein AtMg00810-like [Benincasa hispida]